MWKDFKKFIMRGNLLDMAVGIIIGAAFTQISNSLVKDVLMPPIGLLLSGIDFSNIFLVIKEGAIPEPYKTIEEARNAGAVVIGIGSFINTVISFIVTAAAVFLIISFYNKMQEKLLKHEILPKEKECPYCFTKINVKATRCPNCTSNLDK